MLWNPDTRETRLEGNERKTPGDRTVDVTSNVINSLDAARNVKVTFPRAFVEFHEGYHRLVYNNDNSLSRRDELFNQGEKINRIRYDISRTKHSICATISIFKVEEKIY